MNDRNVHRVLAPSPVAPARPKPQEPVIDSDTATILQYFGCSLIRRAGVLLGLPQAPVATAQVYFHRFYLVNRLHQFDIATVAQSCLYLACKAEETLRKVRDVINAVYWLTKKDGPMLKINKEYWDLRDEIVACEHLLLRALNFDLTLEHPYKYLLNYLHTLGASKPLAQLAWNITNDLYYTPLCLQRKYKPRILACASIYLAIAMLRDPSAISATARSAEWWEVFDARQKELEAISSSLLESLEMLQTIPFESALEVFQEYRSSYSPPGVLSLAKKYTSAGHPNATPPKPPPKTH